MADRFLDVEYDPLEDKLYASRKIEGINRVLLTPASRIVTEVENHGDQYTLSVDEAESILIFDSVDVDVKLFSGPYRVGSKISLISGDSNQITLMGGGVTLYSATSNTAIANTYRNSFSNAKIDLTYIGTDKWAVTGDITAGENIAYTGTADSGQYVFNGHGFTDESNPSLTLTVGQFMEIDNQAGSSHPFVIKKGNVSGATTGTGPIRPGWARLDNNNQHGSANKLRVSFKETGDYYYICEAHSTMKGSITVS